MTQRFQKPPRPIQASQAESKSNVDPSAFIANAGLAHPPSDLLWPWSGLDDKRRTETFLLRFTRAEHAKIRWVVDQSNQRSMQSYCIEALKRAIEDDLKRLMRSELPSDR